MPRTARLDIPGQLYHITARGIERRDIFLDDSDRDFFLNRFSALLLETESACLAWSLMTNHIHLLLRTGPSGLAAFMRRLLTGYAVYFNRRHQRAGHLFQNRYHSILCQTDSYLLPLLRYVHSNPLDAGVVPDIDALDSYLWCGHRVLMGNGILAGQATDEILGYFGKKNGVARRKYREFIEDRVEKRQGQHVPIGGKRDLTHLLEIENESSEDDRILGSRSFAESLVPDESPQYVRNLGFEDLFHRIAEEYSVTIDDLRGRGRTKELSEARAVLCHLAISHLQISGAELARRLRQSRSSITRSERRGKALVNGNHVPAAKLLQA